MSCWSHCSPLSVVSLCCTENDVTSGRFLPTFLPPLLVNLSSHGSWLPLGMCCEAETHWRPDSSCWITHRFICRSQTCSAPSAHPYQGTISRHRRRRILWIPINKSQASYRLHFDHRHYLDCSAFAEAFAWCLASFASYSTAFSYCFYVLFSSGKLVFWCSFFLLWIGWKFLPNPRFTNS